MMCLKKKVNTAYMLETMVINMSLLAIILYV